MRKAEAHFVECMPKSGGTPGVSTSEYPTLQVADGTFEVRSADPELTHTIPISNVTELQAIADNLNGNYYLTDDIDASATSEWNGGEGFDPIGIFAGTLDGCGYKITGLTINRPAEDYVGLFSSLKYQPAGVVDYWNGAYAYSDYFGGTDWDYQTFTASKDYTIAKVSLSLWKMYTPGTVTVSIRAVDGNGKPTGSDLCVGTLNGNDFGGSYGGWYDFEFTVPYALTSGVKYAIVVRSQQVRVYWAGLNGYGGGNGGYSTNSGSTWTAWANNDFLFVTYEAPETEPSDCQVANLTIEDCDITGQNRVGAIAGIVGSYDIYKSQIHNCHTSGSIVGVSYVGGLIGEVTGILSYSVDINDCVSSVEIEATGNYCGGVSGYTEGYINISNSRATGNVSGVEKVGGFIGGYSFDSTGDDVIIDDCSAIGDVTGTQYIGGFVGYYKGSPDISRCSARGDIIASSGSGGGFIGYANLQQAQASTMIDCYAWGNVSAIDYAGGFIGIDEGEIFDNCYSIGTCSASSTYGFGGGNTENATDTFWDTESSGEATSSNGEGHDTSWMQTKANYETAGWDFTTTWELTEITVAGDTSKYRIDGVTVYGFDHMIGETVKLLVDGVVLPEQVVSDEGTITLPTAGNSETELHIGLKYPSKLQPMRPVTSPEMMASTVTVKKMGISVLNTDDITVGVLESDMKDVSFADMKNKSKIDGLYTGTVEVSVPDGYSKNCPLQVITDAPLPATIRAFIPKLERTGL